jgi:hypothetical protein
MYSNDQHDCSPLKQQFDGLEVFMKKLFHFDVEKDGVDLFIKISELI